MKVGSEKKIRGGLDLYQRKEPAFSREQRSLLTPEYVYIPMEAGSDVRLASAFLDKATFKEFVTLDYPGVSHNTFGKYKISLTEEEVKASSLAYEGEKPIKIESMEYDELVSIARRSFIIDETDGVPLFRKLQEFREKKVDAIIADAIDEEPYVSSSINTLMQKGEKVMDALNLVGNALSATSIFAVCYSDLDDTRTVIPPRIGGTVIKKISGKYPIRSRLAQKLKRQLPSQNYGLVGVQSLLHLYRAIYFEKKQNTTIVTVAGDCINYSCNVEVTVGTTIRELLIFVGLTRDPSRVIIRGSMGGVALTNLDLPILHSEKAVLAFEQPVVSTKLPCISCGMCTRVCPVGIAPNFIYRYNKYGNKEEAFKLRPEACIECGCCSYVCPARLELASTVVALKREAILAKEKLDNDEKGDAS